MSIKFEDVVTPSTEQWRAAINGARNPLNSWNRYDSSEEFDTEFVIGPNDYDLLKRLCKAGTDHRKFMRMLPVIVTITAPLYWWKEFDQYKVGTTTNSCSTMHKITAKEISLKDFSVDNVYLEKQGINLTDCFINVVADCEMLRKEYLETKDMEVWKALIQLLPSSYNQKRTVMLNYEVLANIYKSRRNHKLDEWSVGFMEFIKSLPYSFLITGEDAE